MREEPLSADEARIWHAWKSAGEAVMTRVVRDITAATGLSGPDFAVLTRLVDLGDGELRQQDLAEAIAWDKSRLSHQLTRMERRALVQRKPAGGKGVVVRITAAGKKTLTKARPAHARSIRRHLLTKLGRERPKTFLAICERLQSVEDEE
jgi:DNA-binding MarR family transcriptional regulator